MDAFLSQLAGEWQNLHAFDLLTILTLAGLEGLLSVDNALVLAILVRELPENQRKKALTYGIVGAFVFRFLALIFAAHLMKLIVFKLIGGGYLVYLAMKHMFFFAKEDAHQSSRKVSHSFWMTVLVVELTDIAFSIDSITAAVAMSDKLLIVWAGGILGIIFLRCSASVFVRLLEKFPRLEDLAYQLIFFIGTKLTLDAFGVHLDHSVFWMMMGIIAVIGTSLVYRDYHQRRTHTQFSDRLLEDFRAGRIDTADLLQHEALSRDVVVALLRQQDQAPRSAAPE